MKSLQRFILVSLISMLILSACNAPSPTATSEAEAPTPTQAPTASPTPEPPGTLTVCTAELPESLFLYSGQNSPARSALLAMTQDGPFEEGDAGLLPVILTEAPNQANGGLALQPVTVVHGQTVVDARGEQVVLKAGVTVRPSGCTTSDCAVTWDGESALQMDQMVVTFHLVDGLTWSDGISVTAADSVLSYQLASAPEAPGSGWAELRTASYIALDDQTLIWTGKPGFTTSDLAAFFWLPLPSHAVVSDELAWELMAEVPELSTLPLSYGPFVISTWSVDSVQLARNPYYFRADAGLPLLEEITVQALGGDVDAAVAALESGACDVLDASFALENDSQTVAALQADGSYNIILNSAGAWEQLVFGIQPASYDEYFNPLYGDRPDFFGDSRTRQAVAACLDREAMLAGGLSNLAELWPSFLSARESQLADGTTLAYNPAAGLALLEEVGWRDQDLDPATPLQAWEVAGVPLGADFSVTLLTDTSALQQSLAAVVSESLGACGIEVTTTAMPAEELYAPGPEGPIFGRQFDLAFVAWQPMPDLDCGYYVSWQNPSEENQWIGTNIAGLLDETYDDACSAAALALPADVEAATHSAEAAFLKASPAIPLFSIPRVLVTAATVCDENKQLAEGDFFSLLEYYSIDETCP